MSQMAFDVGTATKPAEPTPPPAPPPARRPQRRPERPAEQMGMAVGVADPAPGARSAAVWVEGARPKWVLDHDDADVAREAALRLEVGDDAYLAAVVESGCPWHDPGPGERADVVAGKAEAAGDPHESRRWRLGSYEYEERRSEQFWQHIHTSRRKVRVPEGRPALEAPELPLAPARWVEAVFFDPPEKGEPLLWWDRACDAAWVDEQGRLRGLLVGYPARPVVTVAVAATYL